MVEELANPTLSMKSDIQCFRRNSAIFLVLSACRQLTENKVPTLICKQLVSAWTCCIGAGLSLRQTLHAVNECYNVFFNKTGMAVKRGP